MLPILVNLLGCTLGIGCRSADIYFERFFLISIDGLIFDIYRLDSFVIYAERLLSLSILERSPSFSSRRVICSLVVMVLFSLVDVIIWLITLIFYVSEHEHIGHVGDICQKAFVRCCLFVVFEEIDSHLFCLFRKDNPSEFVLLQTVQNGHCWIVA